MRRRKTKRKAAAKPRAPRPTRVRTDRLLAIVHAARARAKKQKRGPRAEYDLDDHLPDLRLRFADGRCEATGIEFNMRATKKREWNSPSIDRIDARRGYTHDNVRFVLWAVNASLADWGEDVFELISTAWLNRKAVDRWHRQQESKSFSPPKSSPSPGPTESNDTATTANAKVAKSRTRG